MEIIERIVDKINEIDMDDEYSDAAKEFADNVSDIVNNMHEFYDNKGYLSPRQIQALENIEDGLDKWIEGRE